LKKETRDLLAARVPTVAWEGSRLKMMGLDALPTYKRVVAWFPALRGGYGAVISAAPYAKPWSGNQPLESS